MGKKIEPRGVFVLVHGAWHGGWCYRRVASRLRERGHDVHIPTLTGCGERAHLFNGAINLSLHIEDVLNLIRWEKLDRIVLCGHSYGGMVITGVADRIPDCIAALVYLDAFLPKDGQSLFEINIARNTQMFLASAGEHGGIAVPAPSAAFFNVNKKDRAWVDALATPQPLATMTERIELSGGHRSIRKRFYVHATDLKRKSPFKPFYKRAKADGWKTFELRCGHHLMIDRPDELVDILEQAA